MFLYGGRVSCVPVKPHGNPQPENGTVRIATELFEAMMRLRLNSESRQVFDCIVRYTYGFNKKRADIALTWFMQNTGLERNQVRRSLKKLLALNMIERNEGNEMFEFSINKKYKTWKPFEKVSRGQPCLLPTGDSPVPSTGDSPVPFEGTALYPIIDNSKDNSKDNCSDSPAAESGKTLKKPRKHAKKARRGEVKPDKPLVKELYPLCMFAIMDEQFFNNGDEISFYIGRNAAVSRDLSVFTPEQIAVTYLYCKTESEAMARKQGRGYAVKLESIMKNIMAYKDKKPTMQKNIDRIKAACERFEREKEIILSTKKSPFLKQAP
mgnify:CR=1 FL=1